MAIDPAPIYAAEVRAEDLLPNTLVVDDFDLTLLANLALTGPSTDHLRTQGPSRR